MAKVIIEDFYENLGISKHDLFLMCVENRENLVRILSEISKETELHLKNRKIQLKTVWSNLEEYAVYIITEIKNEKVQVFYTHEEFFNYLFIYYLENIESYENQREEIEAMLENYYDKIPKERREPPVIDLKNLFNRFH